MTDAIDWRRLAEVATGLLGWTPETFWAATPAEFWIAWDGWRARFSAPGAAPLVRPDLDRLMARFPDGPC